MTSQAQRIAIAETCGWTWWQSRYSTEQKILARSQEEADTLKLGQWIWELTPDYLSDLNAMHEAEKVLTFDQTQRYVLELSRLQTENKPFSILHATAAQRAEAFLRTLNLWTE